MDALQPVFALADFNFAATGDWGCGSNTDNTVTNIVGKSPEFVFGLGDYSYTSTGTCWFDRIGPIDSITKISIGNHEDDSSEGFSGYMSHFGLQETYYSFNHQNVHVLVLDTDRNTFSSGSPQHNFAVNDLQSASQNPGIHWIIVYFHKPIYTSPNSCCSALSSFRDTYHPLFDQYGVDLVLQGHVHNYQRTFPLKYNTNSPSNPTITNTQANDYTDPLGQVFAIAGAGGVGFHSLSGKASFVSSQQASSFGQLDIKITNDGNKLEGKFYRNSNNAVLDSFSITKTPISSPFANNQNVIVTKNMQQQITLAATDPNNDPLIYSIVAQPQHGTLSPSTPGGPARTYTPATNYVGTDSFTFKANDGTSDSNVATVDITVQDPGQTGGYHYTPSFVATGSTFNDTPDSASLRLNQFTVTAWFKTSTNFGSDAFIVNKGGVGSDSSGQNLNYGIWMNSAEQIKAGFETSSGADQYVTSFNTYNDGQWHYAVVTNNGANVILYIDGVQVATKTTSGASPENTGTKPVRIGANSRVTPATNFFTGDVDEVRLWNNALSASQVTAAFGGTFAPGHVLHLPFGSNAPPVANNQAVNVNKNTQKPITLTATDPNNDPLTYTVVTPPENGTLSGTAPNLTYNPNTNDVGTDSFTFKANDGTSDSNIATVSISIQEPPVANNQAVTVDKNTQKPITLTATDPNNDPLTYTVVTPPENGTLSGTAPNLTYNPNTNHVGTDSFTFKANDGTSDSNIATVSITVQNGLPVANNQAVNVDKNTQKPITLTATDPNNDPLTYTVVTPPENGTLSGTAPNLTYNPNTNHVGTDSFTFKANDGTSDSNIATVSITVQNGLPVANNQAVNVDKNTQKPITLTATDPNNDPLTYTVVTPPENGTLSGTAPNLTYNPNTNHVGTDSFTFKANDGTSDSNIATVSISIQEPPVANNQAVNVDKNTQKPITLTATDPNNDPLTYSIVAQPQHGTLSPSTPGASARTYTPATNYVGTDSFTFKANDGTSDSNIATVSITVQNGLPVANNQAVNVDKNTQKPITLTATDPNNDPLTYTVVTPPENGTLSGTAPNLTYNPNTNHVGTDSFTFKANDGTSDSNIATVSITVQNGLPVANNQAVNVDKNTQKPITLTATDPNNDPLTYSIVAQPQHGTLSPSTPGASARTYTPATNYVGTDSFTFKANDGTSDSNIATVSITVQDISQPGGYNYTPSFVATGSSFNDTPDSASLRLNQFTVAAWFKTSTNFASDAFIVNKGGVGSDSAGQNLNYGIWMASTEQIKAGFETSSGADQYVTSVNTYNDNQWHYAVVTNNGANVILYIDGVQVATKATSGDSPESTGTKPVRVAANSRVTPPTNFFTGEVDEVRIWNSALTASQVSSAFGGTFAPGHVLHLPFGGGGGGGYNYAPSLVLTGSNFNDTPDSASLRLNQFTVASWFKTSSNFASDAYVVNKGGVGSDSPGQNLNYGIWMNSAEQIKAGFETSSGADQYVTSPTAYNDNQWHYAVVTNNGANVILYIDGVQVATKATSGDSPESTGTKPVRVGANSRVTPATNFFTGDVDEVRLWSSALTASQVSSAFGGNFNSLPGPVLHLPFGSQSLTGSYVYDPSLSLSGPP